ncbi:MAG TPA: AMP-binding protein, partial [Candidatus Aminicenantes bacterium]|nr:AMP-binding protein [Candidatus Aminicenantes bacterium]
FIVTVPLLLEKIYKKKVLAVIEKNVLTRWVTRTPLLRGMVFKRIRQRLVDFFGGHLKLMAIGGAPINREVEEFLRASGYPYLIGYGMTESSPLLSGGPMGDRTIEVGSAGKPIPGVEIRIDHPDERTGVGEILARGANVMMGYYQNPGLTAETIEKDGWLHTGDLGRFDRHGNLHVVGRSKNMIVLANGENVYTEVVEDKLNSSIYVSESLLIDRSGRLEAWVYLDYDLVDAETRGRSETERGRHIKDLLERIRQDVNAQLPVFAQILRIEEQNEPFEKTPTHKIKRHLYAHRGEE